MSVNRYAALVLIMLSMSALAMSRASAVGPAEDRHDRLSIAYAVELRCKQRSHFEQVWLRRGIDLAWLDSAARVRVEAARGQGGNDAGNAEKAKVDAEYEARAATLDCATTAGPYRTDGAIEAWALAGIMVSAAEQAAAAGHAGGLPYTLSDEQRKAIAAYKSTARDIFGKNLALLDQAIQAASPRLTASWNGGGAFVFFYDNDRLFDNIDLWLVAHKAGMTAREVRLGEGFGVALMAKGSQSPRFILLTGKRKLNIPTALEQWQKGEGYLALDADGGIVAMLTHADPGAFDKPLRAILHQGKTLPKYGTALTEGCPARLCFRFNVDQTGKVADSAFSEFGVLLTARPGNYPAEGKNELLKGLTKNIQPAREIFARK